MNLVFVLACLFIVWAAPQQAHSRERFAGQFDDIDPATRAWFKSVRAPSGVPCCDISDGHRTEYDIRPDNYYWVPIDGEWRQVPDEAVVHNAGNPVGEAIVWYVQQGDSVLIRCFVPGGGV